MVKEMLTGNYAAAWGARLADVDYVPAFPITPQSEIIEVLSTWINALLLPQVQEFSPLLQARVCCMVSKCSITLQDGGYHWS